jgi:hypothetical protein
VPIVIAARHAPARCFRSHVPLAKMVRASKSELLLAEGLFRAQTSNASHLQIGLAFVILGQKHPIEDVPPGALASQAPFAARPMVKVRSDLDQDGGLRIVRIRAALIEQNRPAPELPAETAAGPGPTQVITQELELQSGRDRGFTVDLVAIAPPEDFLEGKMRYRDRE